MRRNKHAFLGTDGDKGGFPRKGLPPGPVSLVAGGTMSLTENAKVHATVLDTSLQAGAIDMAAGAAVSVDVGKLTVQSDSTLTMADGATMTVQQGTIDITTVGDAIVTGIFTGNPTESAISITSTEGHILAGHTLGSGHIDIQADTGPAAKLTMWAALGIGDEPLNLKLLNLEATSGGKADLAVDGSVNIDSITAVERVLLSATGDITGGSVSASDGYVSITGGTGAYRGIKAFPMQFFAKHSKLGRHEGIAFSGTASSTSRRRT